MAKRENKLSNAAKAKSSGYSASIQELKQKVAVEDEPQKRLNIQIPEALHTELKLHATQEGVTMRDVVEGLLRDYLNK